MQNNWVDYWKGLIEIEMKGIGAERFINRLSRNNIAVMHMKKTESNTVVFWLRKSNIAQFEELCNNQDFEIHFRRKNGFPFFFNKLLLNKGIIAGVVLFILITFFLSNIVWGIKVDGASIETEQKIRQSLDKLQIKVGKFTFQTGNVESVQKYITNHVPNVTWVGVELRGTIYRLQVVEKKQPKEVKDETYDQLVAGKKALIVQTLVDTGQVLVTKHQLVTKGQPLVSGNIGNEDNQKYVGAKGKILGETWYQTTSEVPLQSTISTLTGNSKKRYYLYIFGVKIPIWGFQTPKYQHRKKEVDEHQLRFWKWILPISLKTNIYHETKVFERVLSKEEAVEIAQDNARIDIQKNLPSDAEIIKENVLQKHIENDKVKIVVHYEVIENIAVGKDMQ